MEDKKQQLIELLKIHYGYDSFRPGQEKAIESVLNGKDTLVIMPTGGGKSLIYQLPALVMEGVTIIISPLIALMKDQVDFLNRVGIPATFINSSISQAEAQNRIEGVQNGFFKLLYIAPERFNNYQFIQSLKDVKVSLFAVDEAHCISEWGHDFRPSYTRLNKAVELLGHPTVVALTATATPEVKDDIQKQLSLKDPEIVITGFKRPNLQMGVFKANEAQKMSIALDSIRSMNEPKGIIYVNTRAKVDELTQALLSENFKAVAYHAGMDGEDRKWVQERFIKDEVEIIVATNAFGLGIDKKNIRFVIHYNMPGTVEAYYQEAGRAGRDGLPSFCLLLFSPQDRYLQEFFIQGDNPEPGVILDIYDLLLSYEEDKVMFTYTNISGALSKNVPDMAVGTSLKILESSGLIRRSHEKAGNAFMRFAVDYDKVLEALGTKAKMQRDALIAFNEKYGSELKKGDYFNFEEVAEIIGVKKETLKRLAKNLKDKEVLEYEPPFRGTEVQILKRVNRSEVNIDFEALNKKASQAYDKLNKIEDYVYHPGCRQEFILEYFGDREAEACGKCDNCLNSGPSAPQSKEEAGSPEEEKGKSKLNTKLTQLETLDLYNKGMSITEIAKERGFTEDTVVNHICFLIKKGLIKDGDKLVDKNVQNKIKKVVKEVGAEKLKPIKDELPEDITYKEIKLVLAIG